METVYQDGERLRDMIGDLVGMEFLQGLKGKKIFLKPNWVRHSVREGDEVCLRTHDNFVLGVLEVVLKQLLSCSVMLRYRDVIGNGCIRRLFCLR